MHTSARVPSGGRSCLSPGNHTITNFLPMDSQTIISILPSSSSSTQQIHVPLLSTQRKRHRHKKNHVLLAKTRNLEKFHLKIKATNVSRDLQEEVLPIKMMTLKELISTSVSGLFGENGSLERFGYEIKSLESETGLVELEVVTADVTAFCAALAMLPVSEGRLRVLSCVVCEEE
jgi:hypothetical protein